MSLVDGYVSDGANMFIFLFGTTGYTIILSLPSAKVEKYEKERTD